jgi:apolipoprotein D and lipocalin family protein
MITDHRFLQLHVLLVAVSVVLSGCTGIPENVSPVTNFDVDRYLGRWYEIARLDHAFERGLESVTADYSLRDDGSLRVLNRGYDPVKQRWKEAEGRAYFIESSDVGRLKVSFFGPFYGGYNIIELDHEAYNYAMVCGPDTAYLWILSRQPELDERIVQRLLSKASGLGFDTAGIITVAQQVPHDPRPGER